MISSLVKLLFEFQIFIFKMLVKRNLENYPTILSLENYMTFDFFVTKIIQYLFEKTSIFGKIFLIFSEYFL